MTNDANQVHYLSDYKKPSFNIKQLTWSFDLDPDKTVVSASMNVVKTGSSQNLLLDGEDLSLQWLKINNKLLSTGEYKVTKKTLLIYNVPDEFVLDIQVLLEPKANKALMGLYVSKNTFCTQCEPHGFRRICYFLDRPDILTHIRTKITAKQKQFPVLLSNGNCIGTGTLPGGKHWVEWDDPSLKPCYLFALVAGDFDLIQDSFTTMKGRLVDLRVYVDPGKREQGLFAMGALKRAMKWDEEVYGRWYDLDIYSIVAVSDFNQGAMENKGLNIFNSSCVLASPELATDREYQFVEGVVAHEYFHNWSGNRVTVRDWFQLSLKEGLTIFRDQDFTMDMTSSTVKRIEDVSVIRNYQFAQDAGPMAHPVQPDHYISMDNFYTVTVYNKGAEVIRMMKTLIGAAKFSVGMDLYFDNNDGKAVEIHDFVSAMEQASNVDLTQFKRWYTQSGTPHVHVESQWDGKDLVMSLKQSCPDTPGQSNKKPFFIPFAVGLLDQSGNAMAAVGCQGDHHDENGTYVLYLTEETQVFTFKNVMERPILSLHRSFSAPITYTYDYRWEDMLFLMENDPDDFNRWDISQRVAEKVMLDAYHQDLTHWKLPADLIKAYREIMLDGSLSDHVKAEIFRLPSDKYLVRQLVPCDPIKLNQVREAYLEQLAIGLEENWVGAYQNTSMTTPYAYNAQAVGQRAWRNRVLAYLVKTKSDRYQQWALTQYQSVDNMTEKLDALTALASVKSAELMTALQDFFLTYQHEELAVNKWLMIQVLAQNNCDTDFFVKLLQQSFYNEKNPNCVRAVLGTMSANIQCFHDQTGAGYQFLADQITLTDKFNPMLAARLCLPLTEWRLYDDTRRVKMHKVLTELSSQTMSPNLYEVVNKSLSH
ncbi:MAG: aminopeptidase N [Legionellales bacterium]|nr:aminopeptidase N [Legionellales bacterium]|tara:strand:- start:607 stop:3228 length:2622 start_codon:yes stop_codon:yes gene_type:complete